MTMLAKHLSLELDHLQPLLDYGTFKSRNILVEMIMEVRLAVYNISLVPQVPWLAMDFLALQSWQQLPICKTRLTKTASGVKRDIVTFVTTQPWL